MIAYIALGISLLALAVACVGGFPGIALMRVARRLAATGVGDVSWSGMCAAPKTAAQASNELYFLGEGGAVHTVRVTDEAFAAQGFMNQNYGQGQGEGSGYSSDWQDPERQARKGQ